MTRVIVMYQLLFCDIDFVPRRITSKRFEIQRNVTIPTRAAAIVGIADPYTQANAI